MKQTMKKESPGKISGLSAAPIPLHLILIILVGFVIYSNSFDVPFHLDDSLYISENPLVKDLTYYIEPSKAAGAERYETFLSRFIGHLTFALNYKVHGLDVFGFHLVNVLIHVLNSFLVYSFIVLSFRTPGISITDMGKHSRNIALISALLFVSHPVQTQAVTYITQRFASLATLFYLGTLVAYIKARLSEGKSEKWIFYFLSLVLCILAMKTKEIAITLPVALMLYEFMFFKGPKVKRLVFLLPLFLPVILIPLSFISLDTSTPEIMNKLKGTSRVLTDLSRSDYLFTQFRVITTYIRLLLLPMNQSLEYSYPVYRSFTQPAVIFSFLFLVSLFSFGIYMLKLSKSPSGAHLRLAAFGVFFFFIALATESGFIPIADIAFEHRVYLPSMGAFTALGTGLFVLGHRPEKINMKRAMTAAFILILIVLSTAAHERNRIWTNGMTLWSDVVKKAEGNIRAQNNLGLEYRARGNPDLAIEHFKKALQKKTVANDPLYAKIHNNLGSAYLAKGMISKASIHLETAIRIDPGFADAYVNLGNVYQRLQLFDKALKQYKTALQLDPDDATAYNNIGNVHYRKGSLDKAIAYYQMSLRLNNLNPDVHFNLGHTYLVKGEMEKARAELETTLIISPSYEKARMLIQQYFTSPSG